jgi:hypothetical protein
MQNATAARFSPANPLMIPLMYKSIFGNEVSINSDSELTVESEKTLIPEVIKEFPIATGIVELKEPMKITVSKLIFSKNLPESIVHKPFRRSLIEEEEIEKAMQVLEDAGILERGWSPIQMHFEVVRGRVGKKDGKLRDCFDLRLINVFMLPNNHPMVTIDDVLDGIAGMKLYSTFDVKVIFFQVPLDMETSRLLGIRTHSRSQQTKRLFVFF